MLDKNKVCIFLRHGECGYDSNIYQSQKNITLTKNGIAEIKIISERIKKLEPEIIYVSPFIRTVQSAEIIITKINISVVEKDGLMERYFESIADTSYTNLRKLFSNKFVELLIKNSDKLNIEGEETLLNAQKRVTNCIKEIMCQKYNRILVISHGGPHSWLCCDNFNTQLKRNRIFKLATGHASLFEYNSLGNFQSIISLNSLRPNDYISDIKI